MRVRLDVGEVSLRLDGVDLSVRQVRDLLRLCATVSAYVASAGPVEAAERFSAPIGFTAQVERAPDLVDDFSEFFEDEE
jgi:hypothetical protein